MYVLMFKLFRRQPKDEILSETDRCSRIGCHETDTVNCAYVNVLDVKCHTTWCEEHRQVVAGQSYCQEHAALVRRARAELKPHDIRTDSSLRSLLRVSQEIAVELASLSPRSLPVKLWQTPNGNSYLWSRSFVWGESDYLYLGTSADQPEGIVLRTASGGVYEGPSAFRPNAHSLIADS
jgi:hypothetical protein